MSVIKVNKDNFKEEVFNSDKPVLVDFFATWCGPCRMVSPIVDEIAEETDDYKICKVDVDEDPEIAAQFGVSNIPTLVTLKDGKVIETAIGAKPKEDILKMLEAI